LSAKSTLCVFLSFFLGLTQAWASKQFPARGFARILSPAEASERLLEYRTFFSRPLPKQSFHQAYSFKFMLRHMPRRGQEKQCFGEISGPGLGSGVFRISIFPSVSASRAELYLVSNPEDPEIWRAHAQGGGDKLKVGHLLHPIVKGMNQTFFDLLMPFVFWPDEYLRSGKVAGRPAHIYDFKSPAWIINTKPKWKSVRVALDDTYQAPLRAEVFSDGNQPLRSTTLRNYKKVGDDWIVKTFDCLDHENRSNTRLEILGAANNLDLRPDSFKSEKFMLPLPIPDSAYLYFK
jgi:hypothetical protein